MWKQEITVHSVMLIMLRGRHPYLRVPCWMKLWSELIPLFYLINLHPHWGCLSMIHGAEGKTINWKPSHVLMIKSEGIPECLDWSVSAYLQSSAKKGQKIWLGAPISKRLWRVHSSSSYAADVGLIWSCNKSFNQTVSKLPIVFNVLKWFLQN